MSKYFYLNCGQASDDICHCVSPSRDCGYWGIARDYSHIDALRTWLGDSEEVVRLREENEAANKQISMLDRELLLTIEQAKREIGELNKAYALACKIVNTGINDCPNGYDGEFIIKDDTGSVECDDYCAHNPCKCWEIYFMKQAEPEQDNNHE